jgi:hypothetical protein
MVQALCLRQHICGVDLKDSVQNLAGRGCNGGRSTQNEAKVRHMWLCSPHVACGLSSIPKVRVAAASFIEGLRQQRAFACGEVNGKATDCYRSIPSGSSKLQVRRSSHIFSVRDPVDRRTPGPRARMHLLKKFAFHTFWRESQNPSSIDSLTSWNHSERVRVNCVCYHHLPVTTCFNQSA